MNTSPASPSPRAWRSAVESHEKARPSLSPLPAERLAYNSPRSAIRKRKGIDPHGKSIRPSSRCCSAPHGDGREATVQPPPVVFGNESFRVETIVKDTPVPASSPLDVTMTTGAGDCTAPTNVNTVVAAGAASPKKGDTANSTEGKTGEDEPTTTKRRYSRSKKKNKADNLQLFAFSQVTEARTDTGRSKRRIKKVQKFDSHTYDSKSNCTTGHGFNCPECGLVCSHASKACTFCGLSCSYEAGVGVVVSEERHDVTRSKSGLKRRRSDQGIGSYAKGVEKIEPNKAKRRRKSNGPKKAEKAPEVEVQYEDVKQTNTQKKAYNAAHYMGISIKKKKVPKKAENSAPEVGMYQSNEGNVANIKKKKKIPKEAKNATVAVEMMQDNNEDGTKKKKKKKKIVAQEAENNAVADEELTQNNEVSGTNMKTKKNRMPQEAEKTASYEEIMQNENEGSTKIKRKKKRIPQEEENTAAYEETMPNQNAGSAKTKKKKVRITQEEENAAAYEEIMQNQNGGSTKTKKKKQRIAQEEESTAVDEEIMLNQNEGVTKIKKKKGIPKGKADNATTAVEMMQNNNEGSTKKGRGRPPKSILLGTRPRSLPPPPPPAAPPPMPVAMSHFGPSSSHAMGGKRLGVRLLAQIGNDHDDDSDGNNSNELGMEKQSYEAPTNNDAAAAAPPINNATAPSKSSVRGMGMAKAVMALDERRPFAIEQFASVVDAVRQLDPSVTVVRQRREYNREHGRAKKRKGSTGSTMHLDFCCPDDIRTLRRWKRDLLAVEHEDFEDCDNLAEAREHPSWPMHLGDAHYRVRMGRRILEFFRSRDWRNVRRRLLGGGRKRKASKTSAVAGGKTFKAVATAGGGKTFKAVVTAAGGKTLRPMATEGGGKTLKAVTTAGGGKTLRPMETEGGKTLRPPPTARGKTFRPISFWKTPKPMSYQKVSFAGRDDSITNETHDEMEDDEDDEGAKDDIVSVMRGRASPCTSLSSNDLSQLRAGKLGRVRAQSFDGASSIGSNIGPSNSLENESESLAGHSLLLNDLDEDFPASDMPTDTEPRTESEDLASKLQEVTERLQTVIEEKKELQSNYDSMGKEHREATSKLVALQERSDSASSSNDEVSELGKNLAEKTTECENLAKKLEEAHAKLKARDEADKDNEILKAVDRQSLKKQLEEGTSTMIQLTELLATVQAEKEEAMNKLSIAKSDLSVALETTKSQKAQITRLVSYMETQTAKLQSRNSNAGRDLPSVQAEKDLLSRVVDSTSTIDRLTTEKAALVKKLQGDREKLPGEIKSFKTKGHVTVKSADKEARYKTTIADLEERIRQQNEHAQNLNETITTSNANHKDLTNQVFTLTSERGALELKVEEVMSDLTELQSTFDFLTSERDAANARVRELTGNAHSNEVMRALNSEKESLTAKIEECITRLYAENDETITNASGINLKRGSRTNGFHTSNSLSQLETLEREVSKLSKDKEKLEAYTKQTLVIFQEKYFVTTKEYKSQLKQLTEQIAALKIELDNAKSRENERDPLLPFVREIDIGAEHGDDNTLHSEQMRCAVTDDSVTDERKAPPEDLGTDLG